MVRVAPDTSGQTSEEEQPADTPDDKVKTGEDEGPSTEAGTTVQDPITGIRTQDLDTLPTESELEEVREQGLTEETRAGIKERTSQQIAAQREGIEAGEVQTEITESGKLNIQIQPEREQTFQQVAFEPGQDAAPGTGGRVTPRRERTREERAIRALKRQTPGVGIQRVIRREPEIEFADRGGLAVGTGAGVGVTQIAGRRERAIARAKRQAGEQFVEQLGTQVKGDEFSVAGFERGEEFRITEREPDVVGRLGEAITSGELVERGAGPVFKSLQREFEAQRKGVPIIEPELTPTGRRRFTSQVLLSRGETPGRQETVQAGPLEVTATLGQKEIKTPAQLEFGPEGELLNVRDAPEVLDVQRGTVPEQFAKGTIATLDFGAEQIAAGADVIEDVTSPIIERTTAIPSPTNPIGVFAPEEVKQFSTKVQKGVVSGGTDILRAPEVGLDITRAGAEGAIFTGEQIVEQGPVEGAKAAGAAGAAVGATLAGKAVVGAAQQPIRTGGALIGGAGVGTALSPVRLGRFDVPVKKGGTKTLRGVRVQSPLAVQKAGRGTKGKTVVGLKGKRPTRGAPSVKPERIDFERVSEFAPEIDPTGRFETDVLRRTAQRAGPEAAARFEAAEQLAKEGAQAEPGLKITETEEIVGTARDVPEGTEAEIAEALEDIDAEIFGSAAVRSQIEVAREPRDIDIAVADTEVAKQRLGEALAESDKGVEDVFDIKEKSETPRPGEVVKFGRRARERLETEEGVKVTPAGEELMKKAGGSVFLRPRDAPAKQAPGVTGDIDVGPGTRGGGTFVRVKDPADVSRISTELATPTGLSRLSPLARRRARRRGAKVREFRERFAEELDVAQGDQPVLAPPKRAIGRQRFRELARAERGQLDIPLRKRTPDADVDRPLGQEGPSPTRARPRDIETNVPGVTGIGAEGQDVDSAAVELPSTVTRPTVSQDTGAVDVDATESQLPSTPPSPTSPTTPGLTSPTVPPTSPPDTPPTGLPISPGDTPPPDTPSIIIPDTPSPPITTPDTPGIPTVPPTRIPTFQGPGEPVRTPELDDDEEVSEFAVSQLGEAEKTFESEVATVESVLGARDGAQLKFTEAGERTTVEPRVADVTAVGDVPETVSQRLPEEGDPL